MVCDLKIINLVLGIRSCSSEFPCAWCKINNDALQINNNQNASLRSLQEQHNYKILYPHTEPYSTAHRPLFNSIQLSHWVPAPLHLFLGICHLPIKYYIDEIGNDQWIKDVLYEQGVKVICDNGHTLIGKEVKALIDKYHDIFPVNSNNGIIREINSWYQHIQPLYQLIMSPTILPNEQIILLGNLIQNYRDFRSHSPKLSKNVIHNINIDNNQSRIRIKKKIVRSLTPKEHILINHVLPFVQQHKSIGLFSEQGGESLHARFNNIYERYQHISSVDDRYQSVFDKFNVQSLLSL